MDTRDVRPRSTKPASEPHGNRGDAPSLDSEGRPDRSDDRVTLSARALVLREARRAALGVPEVRADRVEAVRSQLADGSFAVDAERIARSLLDQGLVEF